MWKPWELITRSNERALANARGACTELSRQRVERNEIEEFIAQLFASRAAARATGLTAVAAPASGELLLTLG